MPADIFTPDERMVLCHQFARIAAKTRKGERDGFREVDAVILARHLAGDYEAGLAFAMLDLLCRRGHADEALSDLMGLVAKHGKATEASNN